MTFLRDFESVSFLRILCCVIYCYSNYSIFTCSEKCFNNSLKNSDILGKLENQSCENKRHNSDLIKRRLNSSYVTKFI